MRSIRILAAVSAAVVLLASCAVLRAASKVQTVLTG
jgi:hypothetical protein